MRIRAVLKGMVMIACLYMLSGCTHQVAKDNSDAVVSMQIIDRNGFTETISNKERIETFRETNFLAAQPFEKVLRVYGRNSQGQSVSKITSYHDNGGLCQYLEAVDGRANGIYQEWFANGQLKVDAKLIEGVADIHELAQATWVFDGDCQVYNEEGERAALFHYHKGLLVGQAEYFFPEGRLQRVIPYEQGEIHGVCQRFDPEGHLLESVPYVKGVKEGIATLYWAAGQLLSQEYYKEGKLIEALYWDAAGSAIAEVKEGRGKSALFEGKELKALQSIDQGVIDGEMVWFHPNGTIKTSYFVHEGKKKGIEYEYYPYSPGLTPQPKLSIHWDDDRIQGVVKTWYKSGQLESQREVLDNKKQGTSFAWYQNGDLMLTEEYDRDLLIKGTYYKKGDKKAVSKIDSGKGTAYLYTSEGIFLKKVPYEKGQPLLHSDVY